jgi:hypothetical protein
MSIIGNYFDKKGEKEGNLEGLWIADGFFGRL